MHLDEILLKTKEIAESTVREEVQETDQHYTWHKKGIRAMQDAGLAGLTIPTEHGGLGAGLLGLAKVCESLGKESASMGICFGMHAVGSAVISSKATPYQIEHYLKPICAGEHITTLTLSEPGTGAHFYFPETTAQATGEGKYKIKGTKTFTTNGNHADSYVLSVVVKGADVMPGNFTCVLMNQGTPGMNWSGQWTGIGMRGNSSLTLDIDQVEVPSDNLLGNEGDQIWYVFQVVAPYFLAAMAGTYLGLAESAFQTAQEHLKNRMYSHSQDSLSGISVLQHRLGEMWIELEKTRRLIYHAAAECDRGGEMAIPALCAAKATVAACAVDTVNNAMTICGGRGYRTGGNLERMMRDARAADVMSPTTDLLKTWVGRALLDQPLLQ